MADVRLRNCRILVVEDEYYLAEELSQQLSDAGAQVIGPAPTIECALALLDLQSPPDRAILDVNLGGDSVYPLADTLVERCVPLIFTTGYDPATLPERFVGVRVCEKPINVTRITAAISQAIHA